MHCFSLPCTTVRCIEIPMRFCSMRLSQNDSGKRLLPIAYPRCFPFHCSPMTCFPLACSALAFDLMRDGAFESKTTRESDCCQSPTRVALLCSAVHSYAVRCRSVLCAALRCSAVSCFSLSCDSLPCVLAKTTRQTPTGGLPRCFTLRCIADRFYALRFISVSHSRFRLPAQQPIQHQPPAVVLHRLLRG